MSLCLKLVFEQYWDSYSAESMSTVFSVTKSIVSLLVGIAIDEGYIESENQRIGDFIPEYSKDELGDVKIGQLLEMGSGIKWKDSYLNPFGITSRAYYGNDLESLVMDLELHEEPGLLFEYRNVNTQLLAMVLKQATGMSVSAYTSLKLWKPMGAKSDAWWSLDEVNGNEKAFCGFSSNARDLARFGQLILNEGRWGNRQLVSGKYLDKALSPASHLKDENGNAVNYYGWHWWIGEYDGKTTYSMRGYNGQYLIIVPDLDIVIVRLGHKGEPGEDSWMNPLDMQDYTKIGIEMAE